jgi:hypothetical protein
MQEAHETLLIVPLEAIAVMYFYNDNQSDFRKESEPNIDNNNNNNVAYLKKQRKSVRKRQSVFSIFSKSKTL